MDMKRWKERFVSKLGIFVVVYLLLALLMYWVVKDNWSVEAVKTDSVAMGYLLPAGSEVTQTLTVDMDGLEGFDFVPHFDLQERTGQVTLSISDGTAVLWQTDIASAELPTDQHYEVKIDPCLNVASGTLTLKIVPNETGMAVWAGNTIAAGKFDVAVQTAGLTVNGEQYEGSLVLSAAGHKLLQAYLWFWPVALVLLCAAAAVMCVMHIQRKQGKKSIFTLIMAVYSQYSYLLKQLVWRDFRVKYKSSMLGMVWSFLNPLLTMLVYYFVFSTLFKSNVENFQVYLMSGIVMFNYFSESTNLGLTSIIDNGSLITKVYMPKIIYPLSKVLSAAINLCISFVPLLLVMLVSGVPLTKSLFLLPVAVGFLIIFSLGVCLLLSTMNVFFRDTKFLWSVLLMMWNFLTPIFYPESIIPVEFMGIYRCNPMYQIVGFMRTIILDGAAPAPEAWLFCLLASAIPLVLGVWLFRSKQDRFVLYL